MLSSALSRKNLRQPALKRKMRKVVLRLSPVAFITLLLVFPLTFPPGKPISANGTTRPVVKNHRVGPYEFQVGILPGSPKVGNLHLSILIKDAETGTPVTDATVTLTATGPEGATNVGPALAVNTPQNPQFYDVDMSLDVEGSWTVTLETKSGLGSANVALPLQVTKPGGFSLIPLLVGVGIFLALGFWAWDRIRLRRRRRSQPT